jgi:type II secretory pathway pseudopilin PulG
MTTAIEQTAAEPQKTALHQKEAERKKRVAQIARHRRYARKRSYIKPIIESLAALATVGILIFTIVYSHYAGIQAAAAKNASQAAATQAAIADESMRISQRPYVAVGKPQGPIAEWEFDNNREPTTLRVYFQNPGNTPAFRFWVDTVVSRGDFDPRSFMHIMPPPNPREHRNYAPGDVISARGTYSYTVSDFGKKEIVEARRKFPKYLTVMGNFEYMNIFGEYCCEPFLLVEWDDGFHSLFGGYIPAEQSVCPYRPNICSQQRQNTGLSQQK